MTFLSPWILAGALAASALPILLLHMLRLRRQPRTISSTLLWRRSVEDLMANAPFQRLRWSLLLLLQLAAATAVAAALGRPASSTGATLGGRVIVLLDRSASMNALVERPSGRVAADGSASDQPASRFDEARRRVEELIDRLVPRGRVGSGVGLGDADAGDVLLIPFARRPETLGGFESSRELLLSALASVEVTDEEADLDAALELASAFARSESIGAEGQEQPNRPRPSIVLVTDGNVRPPAAGIFEASAGSVRVVLVGQEAPGGAAGRGSVDNVGIVDLVVERPYDDPASASLFARLVNSGDSDVDTTVLVRVDGAVALRRAITVPARGDGGPSGGPSGGPGEMVLAERLEIPGQALIVVEQGRSDALPSDDAAAVLLPAPRTPKVLLVAPVDGPDPFLRAVLEAILEPAGGGPDSAEASALELIDPATWETRRAAIARAPGGPGAPGEAGPDLVIFDRVAPGEIPGVPSLTIGAAPPWLSLGEAPPSGRARRVLSWERRHPLLRHVDLDEMVYTDAPAFRLDSGTPGPAPEPLALGSDGPIAVATVDRGMRHVAWSPTLRRSNLPALHSFPILLRNAIDWLTAFGAEDVARSLRAGDVVSVRARPGVERLRLRDPDGRTRSVPVSDPSRRVLLPPLSRSGLWSVEGAVPEDEVIPVGQLSALESDLALGGEPPIAVIAPREQRASEIVDSDLWPLVLLAALVLLLLEWAIWLVKAGRA